MAVKIVGKPQNTNIGKSAYANHLEDPAKAQPTAPESESIVVAASSGEGLITVEVKKASEENGILVKSSEETIASGVVIPPDKLIRVSIEGGRTVNLGNYESARINVSISMPCTKEDLNETYEWASKWVDEKVSEAVSGSKN